MRSIRKMYLSYMSDSNLLKLILDIINICLLFLENIYVLDILSCQHVMATPLLVN